MLECNDFFFNGGSWNFVDVEKQYGYFFRELKRDPNLSLDIASAHIYIHIVIVWKHFTELITRMEIKALLTAFSSAFSCSFSVYET